MVEHGGYRHEDPREPTGEITRVKKVNTEESERLFRDELANEWTHRLESSDPEAMNDLKLEIWILKREQQLQSMAQYLLSVRENNDALTTIHKILEQAIQQLDTYRQDSLNEQRTMEKTVFEDKQGDALQELHNAVKPLTRPLHDLKDYINKHPVETGELGEHLEGFERWVRIASENYQFDEDLFPPLPTNEEIHFLKNPITNESEHARAREREIAIEVLSELVTQFESST